MEQRNNGTLFRRDAVVSHIDDIDILGRDPLPELRRKVAVSHRIDSEEGNQGIPFNEAL